MSDLTKLGDDFDIIEVTVDAKEQAEVMERLEQLERHNELLRAFANATVKLYEYPYGVYAANNPYWQIKENFDVAMKAAIDGGALDEDGDK